MKTRAERREAGGGSAGETPLLDLGLPEDRLTHVLERASRLVLQHPAAAQSLLYAFIAEGRRFAETPEGRRWMDALAASEFVRRGRAFWDATHLKLIEDDPETLHPTAILDAIVQVLGRPDVQDLLMRLQLREFNGAPDRP